MPHTPLPWEATVLDSNPAGREIIHRHVGQTHVCRVLRGGKTDDEFEANVDLIVRAVNCHDELVSALRGAEDGLASSLATWRQENGDNTSVIGALRRVRRALKTAESAP